jgi:L-alanine-DL-glutamate epimerase-like enolase superfamily enzyme
MDVRAVAHRGRFVVVTTAAGVSGVGEAAPLAGRSLDTPAAATRAFASLAARAPFPIASVATALELAGSITAAPAARFAIETALIDALAREAGVPFADLLAPEPAATVPLNALVDTPEAARRAVDRGIGTLKVKLGHDLRAIRASAPGVALRLDANQAWPTAAALDELRALADLGLEYVEEPCPDTASIAARSPVPLALDESLAGAGDPPLASIAVVVLKPTLLGLARCLAIARRGVAAGTDVVVTHALEGPVATAACAELARALRCHRACGLDHGAYPQRRAATIAAAGAPGLAIDPDDL